MKKINEMTEREIYALTDEDVNLMIKLEKAENGIKLIPPPIMPSYTKELEKDMVVYTCEIFDDSIVFTSVEELNAVLALLRKSESKGSLDYDYNRLSSDYKWFTVPVKKKYSSSTANLFEVKSEACYSAEVYSKVADIAKHNKKLREDYEKERKAYEDNIKEGQWIGDKIWDKVNAVRSKFYKMINLAWKFKYDYLPLAENNESIAMGFLDKAYSLTEEQKEYVLSNYQSVQ